VHTVLFQSTCMPAKHNLVHLFVSFRSKFLVQFQPFDHLKGVTSSQWGHNEVHSGLAHYLGQSSASHWHIDTHMLSNGMGDMLPKPSVSTVWHMSAFV